MYLIFLITSFLVSTNNQNEIQLNGAWSALELVGDSCTYTEVNFNNDTLETFYGTYSTISSLYKLKGDSIILFLDKNQVHDRYSIRKINKNQILLKSRTRKALIQKIPEDELISPLQRDINYEENFPGDELYSAFARRESKMAEDFCKQINEL